MATTHSRSPARRPFTVGKPRGALHPRVQQVGPEHFGVLCFDCAKVRSKLMLAESIVAGESLPPELVNKPKELTRTLRRLRGF